MQKQNLGGQARLFLKQSLARIEYLLFVFMILQHYCKSYPKLGVAKLDRKNFPFLNFSTRSLVCFTELYSLFYFEGKKTHLSTSGLLPLTCACGGAGVDGAVSRAGTCSRISRGIMASKSIRTSNRCDVKLHPR